MYKKVVWHPQWIQGFHMCMHYECVLLTESVISPILRDDWTLFSLLQTVPGPVVSERYLSSGLGISTVSWFQFYCGWMAAHSLFAPLLQLVWLLSILSLSRVSPPPCWWTVQGVVTYSDFVLAPGTKPQGPEVTDVILAKPFVELLAHKKMFLNSIYLGCCHYRCISINCYTQSSS